ncbi:MAG: tyrosine-type recombinase/integrase [Bacteroides sp.]|nr:tyrosine-type recombinase/integrase [Bacteroides sp.]
MDKPKTDVVKLINEAFKIYYTSKKKIKGSSLKQYQKDLNYFIDYINKFNLRCDRSSLTQEGVNNYLDYLTKGNIGIETINKRCGLITRLINDILSIENNFLKYEFKKVRYVKLQDKRSRGMKGSNYPLNSTEVSAIANCQNLSQKEQEFQTIFLLEIETGLRVSDMKKLLAGDYDQEDEYMILNTTKNDTPAYIRRTKRVIELLEKTKCFIFIKNGMFSHNTYNRYLKEISRKAQLDRIYKWENSKGEQHSDKICDLMSSHNARHTFIQNMRNMGMKDEEIALMTGHADEQMLRKDYNKPSPQDTINRLKNAFNKYVYENHKFESITLPSVNMVDELLALKEIHSLKEMRDCGINIYNHAKIYTVYTKLKATKYLSEAIKQFQTPPPEIERWIYDFVWELCKAHYETMAFNIFEYKLYKLGISNKKPFPEEMVGYWWESEDYANQENLSDLPVELWNELKE